MNEQVIDISFVVPVYNAEKYLRRCVDSILVQVGTNSEVILINDGSTDSSGEICQDYKNKYENVIVIEQENKGQGNARNKGIDVARGKWLCFVDNDDWLETSMVMECKKYLESDLDVIFFAKRDVYGRYKKEYLLDIKQETYKLEAVEDILKLQLSTLNFFYDNKIKFGMLPVGTPWGKLIKTDLIRTNCCYFTEGYGEDRPCMLKLYSFSKKILIINKVYYNYYVHESTMRKYLPNAIDRYSKSLHEVNDFVLKKYADNTEFLKQLYHFDVAWFSYSIMQDFCHCNNQKEYAVRKKDFLYALNHPIYSEAYKMADFRCLPLRRQVLAVLTKYKMFATINFLIRLNIIYERMKRGE